MRKLLSSFPVPVLVFVVFAVIAGCAERKPIPLALDYNIKPKSPANVDFSGQHFSISPLEDVRPNPFIHRNIFVIRDEDDAGIWAANAIRLEMEKCGATVDTLPAGSRPSTGFHLSGRINHLHTTATGWQMGGLLGAATAGFMADVDLTLDMLMEGVVIYSKQYKVKKSFKSGAFGTFLIGADAGADTPPALEEALREMIYIQIFPDIQNQIGQ